MCSEEESDSAELDSQLLEIIAGCTVEEVKHLIGIMEREASRLESLPSEIP